MVAVSTVDPLLGADNIVKVITGLASSQSKTELIIDITTFTHEMLLVLFRLLRLLLSSEQAKRVKYLYTSAEEYSIGDDVDSKWLSKGVTGVRTVLGYPGSSLPSRKTHLIVIVGYEHERAAKLIAMLEPNSISLGFGKSGNATTDKNKDANEHYHRLVQRVASSYAMVHNFEIFCNDPLQTAKAIINESHRFRNRNTILAPMNNKLSTMGSALAVFASERIQVCYASVLEYNYGRYSAPGSSCYLIELPELFEKIRSPIPRLGKR